MKNKQLHIKNVINTLSYIEKNNYEIRNIESYKNTDIFYYDNINRCYDKKVKEYITSQLKNITNTDLILFSIKYPHIIIHGLYLLTKMVWRSHHNIVNKTHNKQK